jgi:hypothetical protein
LKKDTKVIYKSKIANVPTPGYSGHTSIFIKPISYLNKDKIISEQENQQGQNEENKDELPESFKNIIQGEGHDSSEVRNIKN